MTLNGVMAVILRYFTEFGKHTLGYTTPNHRIDLCRNLCTSLLYSVVCVRCRRKESSRSLSHLLMSFLYYFPWLRYCSFLPRCMESRRGLAMRKLSACPYVRMFVRPSVKRVDCDKTEERSVQIFIPYERSFSLVF